MADLLIDDLEEALVERLRARGQRHGRSLEEEVRAILGEAAQQHSMDEARQVAQAWQRRLAGRIQGDSADLLREARDSR